MSELIDALNQIEKEKDIDIAPIVEVIEKALIDGCKKEYGNFDVFNAKMDMDAGEITLWAAKTVVETVEEPVEEISLEEARMINSKYEIGDIVNVYMDPDKFCRIAAQHARNEIIQKIKEEERKGIYNHFHMKEKDIVTGVVQRIDDRGNVCVSLDDRTDAFLNHSEQVPGEVFKPTNRIKLYVVEVKETTKGTRIVVSRKHPELVKRLFEREVTEVADGVVEIKSIAREAGSRTKIAVYSNDPDVDPVGACVGLNGARVNAIVDDLRGEKIDIITWNEDPAIYIKNALSPSDVLSVVVDLDEKSAFVVVPDNQLSLAIGKVGQNARLAARLTGYKIDIKSQSQAEELEEELDFEEYDDSFDEDTEE